MLKEENSPQLKAALLSLQPVLGILNEDPAEWLAEKPAENDADSAAIEALLEERRTAKASKNFTRADEIRNELTTMGITIEDTPEGTKWKRV
ncbi:MAG: hypothetical protein LRY54_02380 [Alphaproteobacteria bacterium]|nr:hypothetical protein [Alphaproteobacteria bacterium]